MIPQPTFEELLSRIEVYLPKRIIPAIVKAYKFAEKAHEGQTRLSKNMYISHPVEVAIILADLEQDVATICSALLHDTLEDCNVNEKELQSHFGDEVLLLVKGVTKLGRINFHSREEEQAENFRKMFCEGRS